MTVLFSHASISLQTLLSLWQHPLAACYDASWMELEVHVGKSRNDGKIGRTWHDCSMTVLFFHVSISHQTLLSLRNLLPVPLAAHHAKCQRHQRHLHGMIMDSHDSPSFHHRRDSQSFHHTCNSLSFHQFIRHEQCKSCRQVVAWQQTENKDTIRYNETTADSMEALNGDGYLA